MKKLFLVTLCLAIVSSIAAQENSNEQEETKVWKFSGNAGLNMSQTSLTNWSAGGDNSIASNVFFNGQLDYKKNGWLWQNNLGLEYGLLRNKGEGMRKTTDKIDFSTQLGYSTNNTWYYTVLGDFKSQFYKGYNYPNKTNYISKFMAPAYANFSIGMEYKPADKFYSIYLSPLSTKMTFVRDDSLSNAGAFGVDPGEKFRIELGSYVKAKAERDIMENVSLKTDLNLFTAYDKSFGNIDVEWNVYINMKINKYLNASINTSLKYDDDVKYINSDRIVKGARVQFKEVLGIGLLYKF